jgi:hypothetical protein
VVLKPVLLVSDKCTLLVAENDCSCSDGSLTVVQTTHALVDDLGAEEKSEIQSNCASLDDRHLTSPIDSPIRA